MPMDELYPKLTNASGQTRRESMLGSDYFGPQLKDTRESVGHLLESDRELQALAGKCSVNDQIDRHAVANFIAACEHKVSKFRHDMPGWTGNEFFISSAGSPFLLGDHYMQQGCYGEAAHSGEIVMALKDKGYVPAATNWEYVSMGGHWAPAFYRASEIDSQLPSFRPEFILDSWLVSPGRPAPTFTSHESWEKAVDALSSSGNQSLYTDEAQREAFGRILSRQRIPHDSEGMRENFIMAKYFLGEAPLALSSEINPAFVEKARADLIKKIETPYLRPELKAQFQENGLTREAILAAGDFSQLKPKLETFYHVCGIDRAMFVHTQSPQDALRRADINKSGALDASERALFTELLKDHARLAPLALHYSEKETGEIVSPDAPPSGGARPPKPTRCY